MDKYSILKKIWGFEKFRKGQEDIIDSILSNQDTIAILPTGGGKSICYQIPGILKEGLCLVISPLIALMQDQTQRLNQLGIKAEVIYSGKSKKEIDRIIDNCALEYVKFLYTSPERIQNPIFLSRFEHMNINLIAIDEAHCISQWGYDFRPEYLKINELRKIKPNVPILAVTASATSEVVSDLADKLWLKNPTIFKNSFFRPNISFVVRETDDKLNQIINILNKVPGSAIIYTNNRKTTKDISVELNKNNIKSDYYHAGLELKQREKKQKEWINNETRVICCTNAFGMGIDKPDVRIVIHHQAPDSIEAYYQEAGRGGRDNRKAYATILWHSIDEEKKKENLDLKFPPLSEIIDVYDKIGNFLQIAWNDGRNETFKFDINTFCKQYKMDIVKTYSCLKILEQNELIQLNESLREPSKIQLISSEFDFYKFIVDYPDYESILKYLIRSYGTIWNHETTIYEEDISNKLRIPLSELTKKLNFLKKCGMIEYIERTDFPKIYFKTERIKKEQIKLNKTLYNFLKSNSITRQNSIINYIHNHEDCRSQIISKYFGEDHIIPCGICDNCISKYQGLDIDEKIKKLIISRLSIQPCSIEELIAGKNQQTQNLILNTLRILIDQERIENEGDQLIFIK